MRPTASFFPDGTYSANIRLANLYRQLGRLDAAVGIEARMRSLASVNKSALANYFAQHDKIEEAAAIYKELADQATDPQTKAGHLQSLANLYAGQQRYTDAIPSMQQAIAALQSSSQSGARGQSLYLRENLADMLRASGLVDQAGQLYLQMLQESRGGPNEGYVLSSYANYLSATQRGAEAEILLKDCLLSGSIADRQQKLFVLNNLANIVQNMGDVKRAAEYREAASALQPPRLQRSRARISPPRNCGTLWPP